MPNTVMIFDIDGTLTDSDNRTFFAAWRAAMNKVFGVDIDTAHVVTHGNPETRVITELLVAHGIAHSQARSRMDEICAEVDSYFKGHLTPGNFAALPGVVALLDALQAQKIPIGIATGNTKGASDIKLTPSGLAGRFSFGGYDENSETRESIISGLVARIRLEFGSDAKIFYFGDTPLDIECGKKAGIKTVAVATGHDSMERLSKCKPDYLFRDLSNTNAVLLALKSTKTKVK